MKASAVLSIVESSSGRHGVTWAAELGLLGAIWGASFLFMRVSAADFGVVPQVAVRLALGALVLSPFLWRSRSNFPLRLWPRLAGVGLINSAFPFVLFSWAAQQAPAGVSAIVSAMTVPFAVLVGALCFREPLQLRRLLAIAMGFGGVVVLALGGGDGISYGLPVAAGILASCCYGVGLHLARRRLAGLPAAAVASATLGAGAVLLAPVAAWTWPVAPIPPMAWLATAALGLICTGGAYVLYYRLVSRIGPSRTATVTYLIPAFGVGWGWALLGEPVTPLMVLSTGIILASVAFAQRSRT